MDRGRNHDPVWPAVTADLTRWTYGATTGLLLAKTDANNAAVTYAYDLAGRRSTRTWARGVVTTYAYDPASGDLTGTSYSDGTPAVGNTYDRRGRIATVSDGSGSRSFTYTASGQVADETITYTGEPARTLTSTYDAWSRRTRLFGPGGLDTIVGYSATTGLPSLAGMAYLPNSTLPAVAPNGTAFAWSATRDSLSEADNLWGATDWTFTYARDALSRITQQTLDLDSGQSVTVRPFGYNARSEVTVSTAESYAYDAQGNRTAGNGQGYTPNALNQYTVVGAATWTYDADGNLTSDGVRTFVYDGENRLTQAAGFTFTYDYRHRVAKQTGTWRPWGGWSSGAAGIAHRYYDGAKVVYRRDVCGGYTQEAGYAWGPDLAGRVVGGDGTGGLASVYSNGRTYYPIHDGRGNIWGFTEGGQTVITRNLTTFGDGAFNPYQNVPVYVPVSLLGFAHGTKEFIPALGLYLFGRRIYDPKTGRFLNRDPLAEDGGLNLYRFVSNNPVNAWDYNGLDVIAADGGSGHPTNDDPLILPPFMVSAVRWRGLTKMQIEQLIRQASLPASEFAATMSAILDQIEKDIRCAELAKRLQYASEVRDSAEKDLGPGGPYGDIAEKLFSGGDGTGLSLTGGGLALTGAALRTAARAARDGTELPLNMTYYTTVKPSTARNMGVAGVYLGIGGVLWDGYNLVTSDDLVDAGWSGANVVAGSAALAFPPTALAITTVQALTSGLIFTYAMVEAADLYLDRLESVGMMMEELGKARSVVDEVKEQMTLLGCN